MSWVPTLDNEGNETGRVNLDRAVQLRAVGDGTSWTVFADLVADLGGTPARLALGLDSRDDAVAFIARVTSQAGSRAASPERKR